MYHGTEYIARNEISLINPIPPNIHICIQTHSGGAAKKSGR